VQKTVNKTAIRDLAFPIADTVPFGNLIQAFIDDNPFGCVGYASSDGEGKRVGNVSLQSPSVAAFEANAAEAMENTTLTAAML